MNHNELNILGQINAYADEVLKGIDPEKTPISEQLEKLRPKMEQIAKDNNLSLEDVFVMYMDTNLTQQKEQEESLKRKLGDI